MTAIWEEDEPAPGVFPGATGEPAPAALVDEREEWVLFTQLAADCLLRAAQELRVPVNSKRRVPVNGASYTIAEASARATALAAVASAASDLAGLLRGRGAVDKLVDEAGRFMDTGEFER